MKQLCWILPLILLLGSCGTTDSSKVLTGVRWADSVVAFSTEYDPSPDDWSAFQALGVPNVYPAYGDIEQAWTSAEQDIQREYLELGFFAQPGPISSIAIFETYNPGFVDTIYVRDASNQWQVVWSDSAFTYGDSSRIFIANFPKTSFNVTAVRLAINEPAVTGWNEIDAVAVSDEEIPTQYDSTGFHN